MPLSHDQIKRFEYAFAGICRLLHERAWWNYLGGMRARDFASAELALLDETTWQTFKSRLIGRRVADRGCGPDRPLHETGVLIRLGGRISLAAATGNDRLLRPGEEALAEAAAAALWTDEPPLVAPTDPVLPAHVEQPAGASIAVEAAFVSLRPRSLSPKRSYMRATAIVSVDSIEDGAAEVLYKLRRPGCWLDIVRCRGFLYRPVLSPRSWEPVSLERFTSAMRSGEAWRDHPARTLHDPNSTDVVMHLDDIADDGPAGAPAAKAREAEEGEFGQRCGDLVLIRDVVFRRTEPPRVRLVKHRRVGQSDQIGLVWECGALASWIDPDPYSPQRVTDVVGIAAQQTLPLEFEFILRAAATALGSHDNKPIATDPSGKALSPPAPCDAKPLARYFVSAMKEVLGADDQLRSRAEASADTFARACEDGELALASRAADAMRESLFSVVESSPTVRVQEGVIRPKTRFQHDVQSAHAGIVALASAKGAAHLIEDYISRTALAADEAAAIEACFA